MNNRILLTAMAAARRVFYFTNRIARVLMLLPDDEDIVGDHTRADRDVIRL